MAWDLTVLHGCAETMTACSAAVLVSMQVFIRNRLHIGHFVCSDPLFAPPCSLGRPFQPAVWVRSQSLDDWTKCVSRSQLLL